MPNPPPNYFDSLPEKVPADGAVSKVDSVSIAPPFPARAPFGGLLKPVIALLD
jgi:hypothetical protein